MREAEGRFHVFVNLELVRGDWFTFRPIYLGGKALIFGIDWMGGWPSAHRGVCFRKEKVSLLRLNSYKMTKN